MRAKTYNIRTAGQANIPVLGLGTWQSTGQDCIDVVSQGIQMGYEHIDTAQAYDNEVEVGKGIKQSPYFIRSLLAARAWWCVW